jgi:hypothetical protein
MAEVTSGNAPQDEGLSHLEAFVALVAETRHGLGVRQAALDARADALGQQAAASTARLSAFNEAVTGLAENFATSSEATGSDLARLAMVSNDLADHVRGAGAEALRASEGRFVAALDSSRAAIEQGAARLAGTFSEIEQAIDRGDSTTAAVVADQEEGFLELASAVAEADSAFSQGDFELQGTLDTTTGYLGEALEQYIATVFGAYYDHLTTDLPPYLVDLLQELGRSLHRTLNDYDGLVETVSADMVSENESLSQQLVRALGDGLEDREEDRERSLDEMRALLLEVERCRSSASRGSEICSAYPPLAPLLAAAREVAERVQEMMDVFNPFSG